MEVGVERETINPGLQNRHGPSKGGGGGELATDQSVDQRIDRQIDLQSDVERN